jgi:hypothetical protein
VAHAARQHYNVSGAKRDRPTESDEVDHARPTYDDVERRGLAALRLMVALPLRTKPAERLQLGADSQQRRETAQRIE